MKKSLLLIAGFLTATLGAPVLATPQLAASKNCMNCHGVEKKVLGPAFKEVAAKYQSDKNAADKLAIKIMKGSAGVWGVVAMPANPQVNEAEAKALANWVLSLK